MLHARLSMLQGHILLCFAFFSGVGIRLRISHLESFTAHIRKQAVFVPGQTSKTD